MKIKAERDFDYKYIKLHTVNFVCSLFFTTYKLVFFSTGIHISQKHSAVKSSEYNSKSVSSSIACYELGRNSEKTLFQVSAIQVAS